MLFYTKKTYVDTSHHFASGVPIKWSVNQLQCHPFGVTIPYLLHVLHQIFHQILVISGKEMVFTLVWRFSALSESAAVLFLLLVIISRSKARKLKTLILWWNIFKQGIVWCHVSIHPFFPFIVVFSSKQ